MQSYDFNEFSKHFEAVSQKLEKRRATYKSYFFVAAATAIAILASMPMYLHPLANKIGLLTSYVINTVNKSESNDFDSSPYEFIVTSSDLAALGIFIFILCGISMYQPIRKYRGSNKDAGLLARKYSLKDEAYSDLIKFFGDFEFAPNSGALAMDIRQASIIPEHQRHLSEDCIRGIMHGFTIKLEEAKITQIRAGERIAVFNGLLIVIDTSEVKVGLNREFAGRTVLIADTKKDLKAVSEKYKNMTTQHLPPEYEPLFEAYTTAANEATQLLRPALLHTLVALHTKLKELKNQSEHFDSKAAYAVAALSESIKTEAADIRGKRKLPSEAEYDSLYAEKLDLTKRDTIDSDASALNETVHAEFFDDKAIITIPYTHDLFETNSLFEPALNTEDRDILFAIMQAVNEVAASIKHYNTNRKD